MCEICQQAKLLSVDAFHSWAGIQCNDVPADCTDMFKSSRFVLDQSNNQSICVCPIDQIWSTDVYLHQHVQSILVKIMVNAYQQI